MSIYYVDSLIGDNSNDGLSEETPFESLDVNVLKAGDTVLFRRGTCYRTPIVLKGFEDDKITISSYGNGELPTFFGSKNFSSDYLWEQTDNINIWKLKIPVFGKVINLVYDFCMSIADRSFDLISMDFPGQWYSEYNPNDGVSSLYIYTRINPCTSFSDIEVVVEGTIPFILGKNIKLENICIACSEIGIKVIDSNNVTINDCRIEYSGGFIAGDSLSRIGNGIELENLNGEISITDTTVYDSSIASIYVHDCTNANIKITGNTFDGYGSTSILTDDSADNILFELNHCKGSEPAYFDTECILVNTIDANLNLSCHAAIYSNKMHKNKSKIIIRRNVFTGKITGENVNNCVINNEDFNLIVENNENY